MADELRNKIKELNKEYKRIESFLIPYGFTLCTTHVFYGKSPFNIYCGRMEDYQSFINDIDNIKKKYLKYKMETLADRSII